MIKEINKKDLEIKCLHLIGKTLVDLGQVKPADEKVVLAKRLSQILITRYPYQLVEIKKKYLQLFFYLFLFLYLKI